MIVFPFMIQEQLITFSFCKIHGWSILIQSFAKFIMGDTYVDAKTVLDSVKSSTWKFFKFRMSGGEVDKNYAFCRFCLDDGKAGKMGKIKFCGGTTNMTNHLKACHKEISGNGFSSNGFIFLTFEYIICRKLPYKYIYYVCETIND